MIVIRSINRLRLQRTVNPLIRNKPILRQFEKSKDIKILTSKVIRCFSDQKKPTDEETKTFVERLQDQINEFKTKYQNVFKIIEYTKSASQNYFYYILALTAFLVWYLKTHRKSISFNELISLISQENFKKLNITKYVEADNIVNTKCYILIDDIWYFCDTSDIDVLANTIMHIKNKELIQNSISYSIKKTYHEYIVSYSTLFKICFMIFILTKLSKSLPSNAKGGGMGVERYMEMKPKKFSKEMKVNKKFSDVAGMDEAKLEIEEFVDFLKHPEKYKQVGAKLPKGALLSGPPGTGKTLLAKACAGEASVPFFFVSGSEFVEMFVGVGASRVRELFKEAKSASPAIIFIDEIDAIGKKRSERLSGNAESDSTLNQLLVEMDGFGTDANVVVFAATNRKELLDPALTRPGRFDRSIDINLPDIDGRYQIFKVHLKPLKVANEDDKDRFAKRLASLTPGFSGADIANICNEAAIQAVRSNKEIVEDIDFELAVERIIGGLELKRPLHQEERRTVAIHECGHGVVSWFLEGADPLLKLTIIPRSKGALGFAQYLPSEISLETREEMEDKIIAILAGRISEQEFFHEVTTGAHDDLQKAFRIANAIVTKLGMSETIGNVAYSENDYGVKNYSEEKNREIDMECKKIIDNCARKCRELVKEHRDKIEALSKILLEKETIDLKVIKQVLGERPFKPKPAFKAYLEENMVVN